MASTWSSSSSVSRFPVSGGLSPVLRLVLLAAVDPGLDADLSVGGVRLGETVVDVGLERVERQPPLLIPLRARDLGAVQPTGAADLDPLRPEPKRRLDPLLHRAPEGDPPLELQRDRFRYELRVRLRPLDLDDVDVDFALHPLLQLVAELVHFGSALPDDDSGTRRLDVDFELVREALDVDFRYPGVGKARLQLLAERQILVQVVLVFLDREPARVPGPVETEAEAVRVDFLSHEFLCFLCLVRHFDGQVALAMQDAVSPSHRGGPDALVLRSLVHEDLLDDQLIDV